MYESNEVKQQLASIMQDHKSLAENLKRDEAMIDEAIKQRDEARSLLASVVQSANEMKVWLVSEIHFNGPTDPDRERYWQMRATYVQTLGKAEDYLQANG